MIPSDVGRAGISFPQLGISETAVRPAILAYILMLRAFSLPHHSALFKKSSEKARVWLRPCSVPLEILLETQEEIIINKVPGYLPNKLIIQKYWPNKVSSCLIFPPCGKFLGQLGGVTLKRLKGERNRTIQDQNNKELSSLEAELSSNGRINSRCLWE